MRLSTGLITYLTAYNNNNIFPNNYYPLTNNWYPLNNEDLKAYEEYCEIGAEDFNETISNKTKKSSTQKDKYDKVLKNPFIN